MDQQESAALDARADALVARASGSAAAGGVGSGQRAGEAARAARVLALRAGSEPLVGMEVLCRLLMSSAGAEELRLG